MNRNGNSPQMPTETKTALKYDLEVQEQGRLELTVPFPAGSHVVVFVVEETWGRFDDLIAASKTSLAFWDNPLDDEDWNAT